MAMSGKLPLDEVLDMLRKEEALEQARLVQLAEKIAARDKPIERIKAH